MAEPESSTGGAELNIDEFVEKLHIAELDRDLTEAMHSTTEPGEIFTDPVMKAIIKSVDKVALCSNAHSLILQMIRQASTALETHHHVSENTLYPVVLERVVQELAFLKVVPKKSQTQREPTLQEMRDRWNQWSDANNL